MCHTCKETNFIDFYLPVSIYCRCKVKFARKNINMIMCRWLVKYLMKCLFLICHKFKGNFHSYINTALLTSENKDC